MEKNRWPVFFGLCLAFCLQACNGSGQTQEVASDWVNTVPTPKATPAPTSTPSPAPSSVPPSANGIYSGDAQFEPFVQTFLDNAQAQNRDVTANFQNPTLQIQLGDLSSLGSSVIGLCETSGTLRRVTFSTPFWNSVDDTQREELLHHELGHCVLYRAHRTDLLPNGDPASIMYPYIFSNAIYEGNYAYYQQELFSQQDNSAAAADPNTSTIYIDVLGE